MDTGKRFMFHFKLVAGVHILVVLLLAGWTGVRGCREPKHELIMPVEFVVNAGEVAELEPFLPEEPEVRREIPEPEPKREPRPEPKPKPKPKPKPEPEPKPKPKPPRKRIKVSRDKIVRRLDGKPQPKRLSDEEIRRRLAMGAKAGNHDSPLPGDEALGFELVRQAMYKAWNQPSREEVGDAIVGVTLRIDQSGRLVSKRIHKPSGSPVMDRSVTLALQAVTRIDGLNSRFLKRHEIITVNFRLEG